MTKQEHIDGIAKIVDEMYNVYTTIADDIAEGLYNAGYRKLDDHAIMVLRKAKGIENRIRKETAEKILFKFESAFAYYDNEDMFSKKAIFESLEEIIKSIGIEIKE